MNFFKEKLSFRERLLFATSLVFAVFILFGGRLPEVSAKEKINTDIFKELRVFTDVLAIVQRDYVREVDARKIVEGAIKGMLATLDPHSGYLDPDFYQDLQVQTDGEFGGLGIEITIKDGLLIVVSPMEGSPAERAGIRGGDAIVKIEGKFTKEFSLVDAVKQLRGPKGSAIAISIMRPGVSDLIDVTVVRDNIQVKSVRSRYLGDGFGYLRLSQFMKTSFDDMKIALRNLRRASVNQKGQKGELKGLILDLRNNPGGLLTQAIKISDLFLSEGVIVYTDGRVDAQKQKFFAHARDTEPNYPIIVLVNGGSASASEIVAAALKDHARALILGTQTFGKGSVQTITPLENGGALTLTTALYYSKSGTSLQATGVRPDIEMDMPIESGDAATASKVNEEAAESPARSLADRVRERDLPGAIDNPNGIGSPEGNDALKKLNKTPTVPTSKGGKQKVSGPFDIEKEDLAILLKRDVQLQKALDLLKTFNIFKGPTTEIVAAPVGGETTANNKGVGETAL